MTSREEKYLRLLELKKVATEFNLVTYFANKYGMEKYNVYFTLDKSLIPVVEPDGAEEEER